jgi:hypothetical protein
VFWGGYEVTTITFVIDKRKHLDGRNQFAILRIGGARLDVVSRHETVDQAREAAHRYASQAKFSGLDARVFQRD